MKSKSKILSPCISVCTMDEDTGWCQGCLRTLQEITGWDNMNDAEKKHVGLLLQQRRETMNASIYG